MKGANERAPRVQFHGSVWAVGLAVLLMGCAAPASRSAPPVGEAPAARAPIQRTLVIASGVAFPSLMSFRTGYDNEPQGLVNAGLSIKDLNTQEWIAWMAEEQPSIDRGTLRVNADGSMVSTWHMRPNISWHDGTPFDTKDIALGLEIAQDPNVPIGSGRALVESIERIETPDSRTAVVYVKRPNLAARVLLRGTVTPMPRHIIEPLYRAGDHQAFEANPYWSTQFIGTGPYRVLDFRPGEVLELGGYADYFLGRPRIDRITWRIITDRQVMLTNVLTNDVHLTLRESLTYEGGLTLKEQWEAAGQGQVNLTPISFISVGLSGINWFDDVRVRRAMLHAIDREEVKETLSRGLIDVAHIPMPPQHPLYQKALAAATKYEYSPQRAEALFQEAGWTRGPDGVLVNARSERLSFEFQARADADEVPVQQALINYWQRAGAEVRTNNQPARVFDQDDYRGRWQGGRTIIATHDPDDWSNRYHSNQIPTEATRWVGQNLARWANPEKDQVLADVFAASIYQPERFEDSVIAFTRLFSQDVPVQPIRYTNEAMTVRTGLIGPTPKYGPAGENARTWNSHLWEWTE